MKKNMGSGSDDRLVRGYISKGRRGEGVIRFKSNGGWVSGGLISCGRFMPMYDMRFIDSENAVVKFDAFTPWVIPH